MDMYDPLTSRYTFSCPRRGETHVSLVITRHAGTPPLACATG